MHRLCLFVALVVATVAVSGCDKKKDPGAGLPPAASWNAPAASPGTTAAPLPGVRPPMGGNPNDPHAGLDMNDPHAGLGMGGQPPAVTELGLQAPDPTRQIDPSKFLKGTVQPTEETKGLIQPGQVIFLSVKRPGPDGKPSGAPIAVERLVFNGWPVYFQLTEAQAMVAGTDFTGDVVITARADQDGDAISKQPGDIEGAVAAKIPSADLTLMLDAPIR